MNKRIFFFLTLTLIAHELNLWGIRGCGSGQVGGPRAHSVPVTNSVQWQDGQESNRSRKQEERSLQSWHQDIPCTTANEQQTAFFPSANRSDNLKNLACLLYDKKWAQSPSTALQAKREINRLCRQEKINLAQPWPQDAGLAERIEAYTKAEMDQVENGYVKSEQRAYAEFIHTFEDKRGARNTFHNKPLGLFCFFDGGGGLDNILDIAIAQQNNDQGAIQDLALSACSDGEASLLEMACSSANYVTYSMLMTRCSLVATDERFHHIFVTILALLSQYKQAVEQSASTRQITSGEMGYIRGDCINLKRMIYTLLLSAKRDRNQDNRKRFITFLKAPIKGLGEEDILGSTFCDAYEQTWLARRNRAEQALDVKNMCLIHELAEPESANAVEEIEKQVLSDVLHLPANKVIGKLKEYAAEGTAFKHVVEDYVLPQLHLGLFKFSLVDPWNVENMPWDMKNMPYLNMHTHTCGVLQKDYKNQEKNLLELLMCTETDETLRVNPRCCEPNSLMRLPCSEKGAAADAIRYFVESGVLKPDDEINGETILNMAIRVRAYEVVKALLARGANPDLSDSKTGEMPRKRAKRVYDRAEAVLNWNRENLSREKRPEDGSRPFGSNSDLSLPSGIVQSRDTAQRIMELLQNNWRESSCRESHITCK